MFTLLLKLLLYKCVNSLESKVNKNGNNSSKPQSTDWLKKKAKSLRSKSGEKPSGQEGHEGTTLELSDNPEEIEIHCVDKCLKCRRRNAGEFSDWMTNMV